MNKPKILVVEDDKAVRNLIATTLDTAGLPACVPLPTGQARSWRR